MALAGPGRPAIIRRRNLEHHHVRGGDDPFCPDGLGPTYAGLDDISVAAVPEPSTWALALLGFAGLAMVGMRRATRLT
jgi:hypothetical protein